MRRLLIALALTASTATAVLAQQPPSYDPRTAPQMVSALQALLALREAEMNGMRQDYAKREADWTAYSAPLWKFDDKKDESK